MKMLLQPFHLVTLSPWPLLSSFSIYVLMVGIMNWFNNFNYLLFMYGIMLLILCLFQWWRDMIRESTYQGFHTKLVVKGLKLSMLLFIIFEVFFFLEFFDVIFMYFYLLELKLEIYDLQKMFKYLILMMFLY